jgi:hypothetical protein
MGKVYRSVARKYGITVEEANTSTNLSVTYYVQKSMQKR